MTEVRAAAQKFSVTNPSLTTTGAAQTLPAKTNYMLVSNIDAAINVLISFDNVTYFTIKPGASLSIEGADISARQSVYLKSASGTPTCEVLYGAEV